MNDMSTAPHSKYDGIGVLITNLGTPGSPRPSAVRRYLREFLSDPRVIEIPRLIWWPLLYGLILPFRSFKSAKLYQQIWQAEGSPLLFHTQQQGKKLQALFDQQQWPVHVKVAMRYGKPSIKQALTELQQQGLRKLLIFPLYPQYAAATVGSTFDAVSQVIRQWRFIPELRLVSGYADDPDYINCLANSVRQHWQRQGRQSLLLMSFHGLPRRCLEQGDPYYCFCHKTARLLAAALNLKPEKWRMVFQSRFGRATWLQPYCEQTLIELAQQGAQEVDVICPGFAADCLETLQEIVQEYQGVFARAGGKQLHYIPALNAEDSHIDTLMHIAKRHMQEWV